MYSHDIGIWLCVHLLMDKKLLKNRTELSKTEESLSVNDIILMWLHKLEHMIYEDITEGAE